MEQRLLIEYRPLSYNPSLIRESVESGAPIILSGVFQEAGTLNQNGRIYPREILEREVQKFQEMIQENRAYGALDHPESSIIELGNAAVLIKELSWEGNTVNGKLQVLNTSKGKDLQSILEAGGSVGVSSRAFGSTHRTSEGSEVVNEDLSLITWDCVANPSVSKAILNESYDFHRKYFFNPRIDYRISVEAILDNILKEY
jgi:Prohead core protein serine protease